VETIEQNFAENLKAARLRAKLTQDEVAEKTGIAQSHISDYESGLQPLLLSTAERLAKAVGVPLRSLI
jgi:transcriptional regulator with XRE-family HTH domain